MEVRKIHLNHKRGFMAKKGNINIVRRNGKKKTRQGMSNNTKYGTKTSKKYYKKRSRGQG
mgnify:FL=1